MRKKEGRTGKGMLWLLAATTVAVGSCVSYDVTRVDTYLGPAGLAGAAPTTQAASYPASAPAAELPAVAPSGPIRSSWAWFAQPSLDDNCRLREQVKWSANRETT